MTEIKGTVEAIEKENNNGHDKKILTVKVGRNNVVFVEFQGNKINILNNISAGQKVVIKFRFNGKISKMGRRYNNIIGKSIKTI